MGRLNTIRINYGALPNKPGLSKVQTFCADQLGLKRGEVIRIQISRALGVTFLTVSDPELARKLVADHGKCHETTGSDKKQYPVTLAMEDGTVAVKLHDLSDDVSDDNITEFLGKFGEVKSVIEEKLGDDQAFAGVFTGVRIATMVVKENIGSWVTINGEETLLSYYGQRQTCKHCRDFAHIGVGCVQNKKLLVQKSFADAVKQPAKKQQQLKLPLKPKGDGKKQTPADVDPVPPKPIAEPPNVRKSTEKTADIIGNDFLVPFAPTGKHPSDSGLLTNLSNQQPHGSGGAASKPATGKSDGNDTDTSMSSQGSRRSNRGRPSKKPKVDDEREEEEEL